MEDRFSLRIFIEEARKLTNLTAKREAEILGISTGEYSRIISPFNRDRFDIDVFAKYCQEISLYPLQKLCEYAGGFFTLHPDVKDIIVERLLYTLQTLNNEITLYSKIIGKKHGSENFKGNDCGVPNMLKAEGAGCNQDAGRENVGRNNI